MHTKKLDNTHRDAVLHFLSLHLDSSMVLYSNVSQYGLAYAGQPGQGEYFGAFSPQGALLGVMAHYWHGGIFLQAPDEPVRIALMQAFRQQVSRPVDKAVGTAAQVESVVKTWGLSAEDFRLDSVQQLYRLELSALKPPEDGRSQHCRIITPQAQHRPLLERWFRAHFLESLGATDDDNLTQTVANRVGQLLAEGHDWLLEYGDELVCLSGFNARLPGWVQVGPVWTPPEHRNRGYARILTGLTLKAAAAEGVHTAILFTDNPAAMRVYEALGFQRIGDYRVTLFKQAVGQ
ncbi:GNAT family N-acetyltransferase [Candidatus Thiothrix sp. Deng01]|uniref:GNAT family N-acetyltransferase n=1 Tax=Candidatus Thiothrix phosphatis TaxID=3112415 RepID=A0ABU6CTU0_9GAMM|nr:GNAT family N-acetyltransferase [Candidatus Thiothrix sp. Deng01]MEB4590247.1 GNAT family N-acetyltransferase [Candidatus Thiothrix sp. Deng01]